MRRSRTVLAGMLGSLSLVTSAATAQGGTDVWVVSLSGSNNTLSVGRPVNLTKRPGYDNQPAFTADGKAVLFTSIRDDGPSDIWRVALDGSAATPFTRTPQSEYSATLMPDGRGVSVIRVELPDSTQRLWAFGPDGSAERVILPGLEPVGYHVWVGGSNIGAFVLGNPNALVLANPQTERVDTLARGIGRAFARVPGREAFTFVMAYRDSAVIHEVDVRTAAVRRLFPVPQGGEYHVWTKDGALIASAGSRLYLRVDDRWDVLADLAAYGARGITRLALSPAGDAIAFVADEGPAR
ncbi:MAG: PD40 domain-containing protein [Gemmatimonadaceae bacterium]|nr:PD40 domain-containing protein [Gemmatimonadaceae bacterium]